MYGLDQVGEDDYMGECRLYLKSVSFGKEISIPLSGTTAEEISGGILFKFELLDSSGVSDAETPGALSKMLSFKGGKRKKVESVKNKPTNISSKGNNNSPAKPEGIESPTSLRSPMKESGENSFNVRPVKSSENLKPAITLAARPKNPPPKSPNAFHIHVSAIRRDIELFWSSFFIPDSKEAIVRISRNIRENMLVLTSFIEKDENQIYKQVGESLLAAVKSYLKVGLEYLKQLYTGEEPSSIQSEMEKCHAQVLTEIQSCLDFNK